MPLEVTIKPRDMWDPVKEEFVEAHPAYTFRVEHSLISVSKWEAKWKKPFLDKLQPKTHAESIDYIRCMTLTPNVPNWVYESITPDVMKKITDYIEDNHTATWFAADDQSKRKSTSKKVTSELIYYWLSVLNLPFEQCEKWHLGRLLTLIDVCNIESQPTKKMSKAATAKQNRELNAARRAKYHSKG